MHHWQKIRDSVNRIFNTTLAIQIFSKRNIMIHMLQHDSHATTEYNYGMAADIYDKKYNVTKCNQTFEHKKIAPNLDKLKAWGNSF